MMKRSRRFLAFAFGLVLLWPGTLSAEQPPLVVELFTSQGCSSCPPADAYLTELAVRPGVLALSMHVDYWNGLGWRDPYSSAEVTQRQRDYARALRGHYVYTPQMIVQGRAHAVGSDRAKVEALIAAKGEDGAHAPSLKLAHGGPGELRISVGKASFVGRATVWLVAYDDKHTTRIPAGENAGRSLTNSNVVRSIRAVGRWTGSAMTVAVDVGDEMAKGYGNCAVIVQAGGTGPIIAAATMPLVVAGK